MKTIKILSLVAVAAAMTAMVSCQKEAIPEQKVTSFSAKIIQPSDNPTTKTHLGDRVEMGGVYKYPILWTSGDKIVMSKQVGTDKYEYTLKAEYADQMKGLFSGTGIEDGDAIYAYYPYSQVKSVNNQTYSVYIPTKQEYKAGSFAEGAMPMFASCDTVGANDIAFEPLMSTLKLSLNATAGESVSKIYVSSLNRTILSGNANVGMKDGTITFGEGFDYVYLDCGSGVALTADSTIFFIAVPANSVPAGYRVKFVMASGKVMNKEITNKTFSRGYIKNMPRLDFAETTTFTYTENQYTSTDAFVVDGVVFAPANCGQKKSTATSGKFYQWGRQYGHSASASVPSDDIVSGQVAGMAAGQVTETFYVGNTCWYSGNTIDDQWWSNYDPCPMGWRVPSYEELLKLRKSDITITGYHHYNTGALTGATSYACFWSFEPATNATQSKAIRFESTKSENVTTAGTRAQGFSVRCVQE